MARVSAQMPADFETAVHFNPSYNPWDQRVCLVPDGDFFKAVRDGDAEMVTGTIDSVTEGGIKVKLCSSPGGEAGEVQTRTLPADVIVTATGLTMQVLSAEARLVLGSHLVLGGLFGGGDTELVLCQMLRRP